MGLNDGMFVNKNNKFVNVYFDIEDGFIEIYPINVEIEIVGNSETVEYDGEPHSVYGYEFRQVRPESPQIVTAESFGLKDGKEPSAENSQVGVFGMGLNGGSAVPLWNTWLDGMQEGAPEAGEIDVNGLKQMFASAFEALDDMSGAKVGDKTMMDTVIPASEAIAAYSGDSEKELFSQAAAAAAQGAENSKNFVSKFGRAKSYGAKTLGTPDAGAVSMAKFFEGLAKE